MSRAPENFVLLNDPASDEQLLIRNKHVSAVEVKKGDEAVTVHLVGGQTLRLTHEQAKQFVQHVKKNIHPVETGTKREQTPAKGAGTKRERIHPS